MPPEPSPFVEGVRLGYAARLNVAGRRAFLTADNLLLALHDDGVQIEHALLEGMQQDLASYPRVFGNMPQSGWAVRTRYAEHADRDALSRWTGSEWVNADGWLRDKEEEVLAASPWSHRRLLLLVGSEPEGQLHFAQVGGTRGALPALPSAVRDEFLCLHALQPGALTALPSGEVYLAGKSCSVRTDDGQTSHGVIINSWSPGQTRAKVTLLPGLSDKEVYAGEISSILAISGRDVYAAGTRQPYAEYADAPASAYLAHFDGKTWRLFSAPPVQGIDDLQRTPDGRLWALGDGQIWSTVGPVSEATHWQRLAPPELAKEAGENSVSSFWAQNDEQVWATLGWGDFIYLVHTKRGSAPLSAPSDQQLAQLSKALDPRAACDSPTLILLSLARNAPKNADMPRIRAALRGYTELKGSAQFVELPFLTRRYLGVRGDLDTLMTIREILSKGHLPGVALELRCLNSQPTRILTIDFGSPRPGQPTASDRAASRRERERAQQIFDLRNP